MTLTRRSLVAQVGGHCLGHLADARHLQSLLSASAPSQPQKDGEAFCQWEKLRKCYSAGNNAGHEPRVTTRPRLYRDSHVLRAVR